MKTHKPAWALTAARMLTSPVFLTSVVLLLLLTAYAGAQSSVSGDLTGTVTDPAGAVVANAAVSAVNNANGLRQATETSASGTYHIPLLPPGEYTVTITAGGFRTVEKKATVVIGGSEQVDIQLQVQSQATTVEVLAEGSAIQTENADIQSVFNTRAIQDLPNPGSDITFYGQLSPGAVMNTGGGLGNFSVFGLPGTSNLFTLNGQNDNDPFLNLNNSGATNLLLGANEMAEVSVTSNGYSVQYGQLAGAAVNYVTKSGTNGFHGNLKYTWDGRLMNANDFFNNANDIPRQFVNANQWADSIGGPIIKNKLFFFVNNEGLEVLLPTGGGQVLLPSAQFQAATLANLQNIGMGASIPFYQKMFGVYNGAPGASTATPLPGGGCGGFDILPSGEPCVVQFRSAPNAFAHEWQFATRADYDVSDRDRFYWRYQTDHGVQPTFTDPVNPLFNATSVQPEDQGQFNWTHIFGPTSTNQFVGSALYYNAPFGPLNPTATDAAFPSFFTTLDGSLASLNTVDSFAPQGREVNQWQIVDDYSLTLGKQNIKIGYNYHRDLVRDYDFGINTGGEILAGTIDDVYNGVLGAGGEFIQNFPSQVNQQIRTYQLGLYVEDDIRLTSRLKLNLGLRADHNSNPTCLASCFSTSVSPFTVLDHDPNVPYNEAVESGRNTAYYDTDFLVWEPRVGFAYSMFGNKTVLRGGAGIFGDSFPAAVVDGLAENIPYFNTIALVGGNGYGTAPISPAQGGNVFSLAGAASQAVNAGFGSGATVGSLTASNPAFSTPNLITMDNTVRQPRYYEWNFEIQQQLPLNTVLSVNYVGNRGVHLAIEDNGVNGYCPAGTCAAGFTGLPSAPVDTRFTEVTQITSAGVSRYNGLIVSLNKNLSSHVQITFNYTWSHALDDVSNGGLLGFLSESILNPVDPNNIHAYNYGNADYDVRQYVSGGYVISDVLRGAGFHRGPNAFFGGWNLAGTVFFRTGFPFSVVDGSAAGYLPGYGGTILATTLTSGRASCGASAVVTNNTPCLNLSDFAASAAANAANNLPTDIQFGNQTRNQYRGPDYFDTDLNVYKTFTIHENLHFQVGAEFFNLFNHPNFALPVNNIASPFFGQITSTASVPTSILGSGLGGDASPRLIQLHGEITF
jgi:outer membrane receptor protein involved in Fe transport